jgi:hypothetical protein
MGILPRKLALDKSGYQALKERYSQAAAASVEKEQRRPTHF